MSMPDPMTATLSTRTKRIPITIPGNAGAGSTLITLMGVGANGYVPSIDGGILSIRIGAFQPGVATARTDFVIANDTVAGSFAAHGSYQPAGVEWLTNAAGDAYSAGFRSATAGTVSAIVILDLGPV